MKVIQARRPFRETITQIPLYRELLLTWTLREIRARYRQSALGIGWAVIQPLFQLVVISVVFGGLLRVRGGDSPYPVFAFVAILPWSLFAGAITASVPSVLANMELVTKIYCPREIFPLSAILARMIDFFIASLMLIALMIYYQIPFHPTVAFVIPLLVIQIVLSMAIGLLGAAVSVFLRDISFAIPLLMQIWMYLSPVIYPVDMVPLKWRPFYMLNPMAGLIDSYRRVILDGTLPHFTYLYYAAGVSVILFVIAYWYFKRLEMAMADII